MYTINEDKCIEIDKDIYVTFSKTAESEDTGTANGKKTKHYFNVILKSKTHNVEFIKNFIRKCEQEYTKFITHESLNKNHFIEVDFNDEKKHLTFEEYDFKTTRTLNNVFFTQKDELMTKLNFFLNNKPWYDRTGKPYTFGIMLHGYPGCGKTSFIKALLNSTKRCGIKINMNNKFDLTYLHKLVLTSKVGNLIIPQDRRILIFEEIDCMGDIVKNRKDKENEIIEMDKILESYDRDNSGKFDDMCSTRQSKNENNLAILLNIFDGLIEASGRMCVFTTNHLDHLDDALIRPGRVDCLIKFTKCTKQMLIDVLNHFYDIDTIGFNDVKGYEDHTISPAEVDYICFKYTNYKESIVEIINMSKNVILKELVLSDNEPESGSEESSLKDSDESDSEFDKGMKLVDEATRVMCSGDSDSESTDDCGDFLKPKVYNKNSDDELHHNASTENENSVSVEGW